MSLLLDSDNCKVYITPILPKPGQTRRDSERDASAILIAEAFGAEAKLGHTSEGAPFIQNQPGTALSLSHCRDFCVTAISPSGISTGIDIEAPRHQLLRVADRILAPSETAVTDSCLNDDSRLTCLLKLWTAKEAVYKAALTPGLGFAEIITSPDFTHAHARGTVFCLSYLSLPSGELIAIAQKNEPGQNTEPPSAKTRFS